MCSEIPKKITQTTTKTNRPLIFSAYNRRCNSRDAKKRHSRAQRKKRGQTKTSVKTSNSQASGKKSWNRTFFACLRVRVHKYLTATIILLIEIQAYHRTKPNALLYRITVSVYTHVRCDRCHEKKSAIFLLRFERSR